MKNEFIKKIVYVIKKTKCSCCGSQEKDEVIEKKVSFTKKGNINITNFGMFKIN
jgi:hypothetical protein